MPNVVGERGLKECDLWVKCLQAGYTDRFGLLGVRIFALVEWRAKCDGELRRGVIGIFMPNRLAARCQY